MNIVCDIGGTNMRVASIVHDQVANIHKIKTPADPKEGISSFLALAKECAAGGHIDRVVGCFAGKIDNGVISGAHNLSQWNGTNINAELSEVLNANVEIINDAELVGLGEACSGAGRGSNIVAYITVSTGVGGALIHSGTIAAAEWVGGILVHGTELESLISGTAVRKRFGMDPKDLANIEARNMLADELAEGLHSIATRWNPEVIVLGGSMMVGINPIPLERVQEATKHLFDTAAIPSPRIAKAELGDTGGLQGALARIKQLNSEHDSA